MPAFPTNGRLIAEGPKCEAFEFVFSRMAIGRLIKLRGRESLGLIGKELLPRFRRYTGKYAAMNQIWVGGFARKIVRCPGSDPEYCLVELGMREMKGTRIRTAFREACLLFSERLFGQFGCVSSA